MATDKQFEEIVRALGDAILVVSRQSRLVLYANPAASELFGREPGALLGEDFPHRISPTAFGEAAVRLERRPSSRGLQPIYAAEMRATLFDWQGQQAWLLSLRARPEALPRPQAISPATRDAAPPAHRVLIIDDEESLARAFQRMLESDYEVHTVSGGDEAIALLRQGIDYDVILCDLMMPRIDGIAVYECIREERPELLSHVVFCSGGVFTAKQRSFLQTVPNRFLEKPVSMAQLRKEVAAAIKTRCAALESA